MKKYIFYLLLVLVWASCEKEDALESKVDYFNLYTITDNPNDSVQHLRYEIYKEYGIPVYFTDTVGKYPLAVNIYGDTIYEYELLDLNWEFTNSAEEDRIIEYDFLDDDTKKYNSLLFVKKFIENSAPSLRPLSMMVVDSLMVIGGNGGQGWEKELHNFRTIVWADIATMTEEEQDALIDETCKNLVGEKIQNYTYEITQFQMVSDQYYGNRYPTPLPYPATCITEIVDENNPFAYLRTWFGQNYVIWVYDYGYSHEEAIAEINNMRASYCAITGAWGFVYGYGILASYQAPNADDDLDCYLERILSDNSAAWFEKYYSNYPLVMKKYEILYDLIVNEMGVKLNNGEEE